MLGLFDAEGFGWMWPEDGKGGLKPGRRGDRRRVCKSGGRRGKTAFFFGWFSTLEDFNKKEKVIFMYENRKIFACRDQRIYVEKEELRNRDERGEKKRKCRISLSLHPLYTPLLPQAHKLSHPPSLLSLSLFLSPTISTLLESTTHTTPPLTNLFLFLSLSFPSFHPLFLSTSKSANVPTPPPLNLPILISNFLHLSPPPPPPLSLFFFSFFSFSPPPPPPPLLQNFFPSSSPPFPLIPINVLFFPG